MHLATDLQAFTNSQLALVDEQQQSMHMEPWRSSGCTPHYLETTNTNQHNNSADEGTLAML
jgi:hypothetical protein